MQNVSVKQGAEGHEFFDAPLCPREAFSLPNSA